MSSKRISAEAIIALKDALPIIYWYKTDLQRFLKVTISQPDLLARVDWDATKRSIVEQVVDYMVRNELNYQADLLKLLHEVSRMTDFSHLEKLEDGAEKAKKAKTHVNSLASIYKTHQDVVEDFEKIEQNRKAAHERQLKNKGMREKLESIRLDFINLHKSENPQNRGYVLEKVLKDLFFLFDLDPKASFRVTGEQIDGAFTFDSTDYLLEAKWQKSLVDISDLDSFSGKISRKLENTLGLYVSINGYSQDSIAAHSTGRKQMILMDGRDLTAVLEERIDLQLLLLRKRRHAAQTGEIYLTIDKILG